MSRASHRGTLRARVLAWYLGLMAIALLTFGSALYFGIQAYLMRSLEHSLSQETRVISAVFMPQIEAKGASWVRQQVSQGYAPEISGRFIRITRQDGTVLYQSGNLRDPYIDPSAISHPSFLHAQASFRQEKAGGLRYVLIFTQPCASSSGVRYLIETGASVGPIRHVVATILWILLFLTPFVLLMAAISGHILMSMPLRPLAALTHQAERIGTRDPGERLPVLATGDEMERLSISLNSMIDRLEEALAHNRRFSADVSHDLRTPLTILRGELEHMLRTSRLDDTDRESIGSSLEEIERMSTIVESLLTISRLDSGTKSMDVQPMNLSELVRWTVEQVHVLSDEKHISLRSTISGPVWIMADSARIRQILVNLLDNAIKYTPAGGEVSVSVTARPEESNAVLEVRDTGIGIPAASLPHVFDRFYRSDKARVRESGGSGLGLAIVRAICKAHNGVIAVESLEGHGTTMRLKFPLVEPVEAIEQPATASPPGSHTALDLADDSRHPETSPEPMVYSD